MGCTVGWLVKYDLKIQNFIVMHLKSIYYKKCALWIFALQESNTFVEIIERKYGQARDFEPTNSKSEVVCANHYAMEASYKTRQD